jgi:hypothetical protein
MSPAAQARGLSSDAHLQRRGCGIHDNRVRFDARTGDMRLREFDHYSEESAYLDASRASSGSISRTIAQTAAIRAAMAAESALVRSASSWSMASARRQRADSSIEHTIEGYQVDGARGRACRSLVIHTIQRRTCGKRLWIISRKNPSEVFLPHSR